MPIRSDYRVQCSVCWRIMEGNFETRDAAEDAATAEGWRDIHGLIVCPDHASVQRPLRGQ